MHCFKFKFLFIFFTCNLLSFAGEFEKKCLDVKYDIKISHKGIPFGMIDNIFKMKKNKCLIDLSYTKLFFFTENWLVDICREPIHIKEVSAAIKVYKKQERCQTSNMINNKFCATFKKIINILQDYGLIFAEGAKEELATPHGKVHCTYRLLELYLEENMIFTSDQKNLPSFLNTKIKVEDQKNEPFRGTF